jgi:dethiobiotin synthetase
MDGEEVAPLRFGLAAAPPLAAAVAGLRIEPDELLANAERARRAAGAADALVVEGVGGLLAPLARDFSVRDFACALELPLLIAARPALGTISHTLLTLEAARAAGLDVCAVVLTPWPPCPSMLERSNRETIERDGAVEVAGLPFVPHPTRRALARAGATLPWLRWIGGASSSAAPAGAHAVATLARRAA